MLAHQWRIFFPLIIKELEVITIMSICTCTCSVGILLTSFIWLSIFCGKAVKYSKDCPLVYMCLARILISRSGLPVITLSSHVERINDVLIFLQLVNNWLLNLSKFKVHTNMCSYRRLFKILFHGQFFWRIFWYNLFQNIKKLSMHLAKKSKYSNFNCMVRF